MSSSSSDSHLVDHLVRQSGLSEDVTLRLIEEVIAFYNETPHDFIRRRHIELQKSGLSNERIYTMIAKELTNHRFCCEPMTTRQIRRAIYG